MAISAPYGGKDQGGVVFIYFGTKNGIETFYRQVRNERAFKRVFEQAFYSYSNSYLSVHSFGVIWVRIRDPRSLRLWYIKGSVTRVD